ncbi:hypothetical protein BSZ39_10260 [Bowdeniella nasicola]|uniref:N-acetyltransferase domain-containing protein n=1 Tax=Bowdeniella nasicola TaxID=208480 RepID=A0A1Q5Q0A3_9ACTO|nr:hypothetical protein BSZ39_10260 [Bowdeniella nasicola]
MDLISAHRDRLRALDPALAIGAEPPTLELTDHVIRAGGGLALLRHRSADPADPHSAWGPLRTSQLTCWHDGNLSGLVDLVTDAVAAAAAHWRLDASDRETCLAAFSPARDTAVTAALLETGFAPISQTGVLTDLARLAPAHELPAGHTIAPLSEATDEQVLPLIEALGDEEADYLVTYPRPVSPARSLVAEARSSGARTSFVTRSGKRVVGIVTTNEPGTSDDPADKPWFARSTSLARVGYLGLAYVVPDFRGRGVMSSLVTAAHAAQREIGTRAMIADYSVTNPYSCSLWHKTGYRPLHHTWRRRVPVS